eukprot:1321061-Amorphochlora_amoeboformis.AAC.2
MALYFPSRRPLRVLRHKTGLRTTKTTGRETRYGKGLVEQFEDFRRAGGNQTRYSSLSPRSSLGSGYGGPPVYGTPPGYSSGYSYSHSNVNSGG